MIAIRNATICAGTFTLKGLELVVPAGSYGVLMGETGSGKTTLVEAICGLRRLTEGRILLGDRDVTDLSPTHRNVGYVPQDGVLFSGMSVREHLTFPLKIRRWGRSDCDRRADELVEALSISHLLERSTNGLSGGERQRVAIGRALSWRPNTLVLDEPLSAVDEAAREDLFLMLKQVQIELGMTTLHVTHSAAAAEQLADQRFELRSGSIISLNSSLVKD